MRQIFYRIGQFRRALRESPTAEGLAQAKAALEPGLFALFMRMLPFEQAHSIWVFDQLLQQGYSHPDLLQAALLHDVGKSRHPLQPWQRAVSVVAEKFFPGRIARWGQRQPGRLLLGVVVSEQHAGWGAEMAKAAGAGDLVVRLIANHQKYSLSQLPGEEQRLLRALQAVDKVS